jgi:hypothetical protein
LKIIIKNKNKKNERLLATATTTTTGIRVGLDCTAMFELPNFHTSKGSDLELLQDQPIPSDKTK